MAFLCHFGQDRLYRFSFCLKDSFNYDLLIVQDWAFVDEHSGSVIECQILEQEDAFETLTANMCP